MSGAARESDVVAIVPERRYDFVEEAPVFDVDRAKATLRARAARDGYDLGFFGEPTTAHDFTSGVELVRLTFTAGRKEEGA